MIAEKQTKSNIGFGVGIVMASFGGVAAATQGYFHIRGLIILGDALSVLGDALSVVGFGLFTWGCVNYAQGKGYSPWLGLLGLLSGIGLIVLVILPDKYKGGGPPAGGGGYAPPQPGVWPPPPSGTSPPSSGTSPPFGQPPASPQADVPRKTLGGDDLYRQMSGPRHPP